MREHCAVECVPVTCSVVFLGEGEKCMDGYVDGII